MRRRMDIEAITESRIRAARQSFVTRRVDRSALRGLRRDSGPVAGDLALARVRALGHHTRLQAATGRRIRLFPGDEIIVAFGHRYAPQQFEALVPPALAVCHLVASGGVAAQAICWHHRIHGPTEIEPLGLLADAAGRVVNLRDWALPRVATVSRRPGVVIAVAGTSMDAGKTTTAAHFVRGLCRAGFAVGAAKITGTGACNDIEHLTDAGASPVLDFTDAGHVSTHRLDTESLIQIGDRLLDELGRCRTDVAVIEIADGLAQAETAALLATDWSRRTFDGVVFCAGDALGADAGIRWLRDRGHRPLGIGGLLTAAPLSVRETSCLVPDVPVLDLASLSDSAVAARLIRQRRAAVA
jgi:hypothetical protein